MVLQYLSVLNKTELPNAWKPILKKKKKTYEDKTLP